VAAGQDKEVAHYLGNTPAVCRSSYVDPRLVDHYLGGATIAHTLERVLLDAPTDPAPVGTPMTQGPIEAAVIDLLDGDAADPLV